MLDPVNGDTILDEDRTAYEYTLSYVGLAYKGIVQESDSPLASNRRFIALPARLPDRFSQLIEERQPRAVAILAHIFACMRLIEDKSTWFKGIAQRQVPIVCMTLPPSWGHMVQWPLEVIGDNNNIAPNMT